MKRKILNSVIFLFFVSAFFFGQVVEEDLAVSENLIKNKYEEAVKKFNSLDQSSSIYDFNEIIVILEAAKRDKTLSPSLLAYLKESYDYRAQVYFNLGDEPKAEADIVSILNYDMDYFPSKDASVKYLKLFESMKVKVIGYYSVSTKPANAKIYLDEKLIGYSNTPVLRYKSGVFVLKAVLDGYTTAEKTIEIIPGQTTKIILELQRVAASLFLQTSPSGVEVYLDDKYIDNSSGTAKPEDAVKLQNLGIGPENCSAVLTVPNIKPGKHHLLLKKPCYQDFLLTLDIAQPEDYFLNPMVLTSSQGQLIIKNAPENAEIILNGQIQGKGSLELKNLCSGPYNLIVRFEKGKYLKQFELRKDETITVEPSKKPTLLFGGVLQPDEGISYDNALALQSAKNFDSLETLNVYIPTIIDRKEDKNLASGIAALNDNLERIDITPGLQLEPAVENTIEFILNKYEADMVLFLKKADINDYYLILFAKGLGSADVESFEFEEGVNDCEPLQNLIKELDSIPVFQAPWLGMFPIEPPEGEGLYILEVRPNSPAANAGVIPGDRMLFLNSRRITDGRRYNEVLNQLKPDEETAIQILRDGKTMDLKIKAGTTTIIPKHTNGIYYISRALAEIEAGKKADDLKDASVIIPFLKSVLSYYLNSNENAIREIGKLGESTSDTIDPGIISYIKSRMYEKSGDLGRAGEEKTKSLKYPDSRIYDKIGMPVSLADKYSLIP